jgi:hypothetical protein
MLRGAYLDGVRDAYLGEIAGAAFAQGLGARAVDAGQRDVCALIEHVETVTAQVLAPLLAPSPDAAEIAEARQRGNAAVERMADWDALIDYTAYGLDGYVDDFVKLRDAAPPTDRPALDLLVDHEVALRAFGAASLSGEPDPERPLRLALAAAERHLAAAP